MAGRMTLRLQIPDAARGNAGPVMPLTATRDGFALSAAVGCRADERRELERSCRYVARAELALERLNRDDDGLVVHALNGPFREATTGFGCTGMYECREWQDAGSGLFEPLGFLGSGWPLWCSARQATLSAITGSSRRTAATAASSCRHHHTPDWAEIATWRRGTRGCPPAGAPGGPCWRWPGASRGCGSRRPWRSRCAPPGGP